MSKLTPEMIGGASIETKALEDMLKSVTRKAYVSVGYNRCPLNVKGIVSANVDADSMTDEGAAELQSTRVMKSFLDEEDIKYLSKITARARAVVEKHQISEHLVPSICWSEIEEQFNECKIEFENRIDLIVSEWDDRLKRFESANRDMLAGIKMPDEMRNRLLKEIMQGIPTKSAFRSSAYMLLSGAEKDAADLTFGVIQYSIAKAFEPIKAALVTIEQRGKVAGSSITTLTNYANSMEKGNVFNNPIIDSLVKNLKDFDAVAEIDDRYEILKDCFLDCYEYAEESGFSLSMDGSPFTQVQISNFRRERALLAAM